MKKLFLTLVALVGVYTLSAQTLTETYNAGATAYSAKNYAEALPALETVIADGMISENPDEQNLAATAKTLVPNCYFRLAMADLQAKNYEAALEKANRSLDLAILYDVTKTENNAKRLIGMIYQQQGGEAYNAGDYATAAQIFAKGYEADPRNAQMANWLGSCYCELGDYTQGLAILNKVASNPNPKYAEQAAEAQNLVKLYTNNMVAGFQQNGDFDGMIAAAEQMLASEPENAVALKIRVQAYEGKKDLNKVIELAEAADLAQSDAEDANFLYYLLGSAYNAKEMKPQAIAAVQKVTAGPSMEAAQAALAELTK
jgi:tetratricopeptide (TPR) repeat protein